MPAGLLPELTPTSLPDFTFLSPTTVSEALLALTTYGRRAKVIAGGSDLLHLMKRDALVPAPDILIDIKGIGELRYLENAPDGLKIGPLTTIATIETDPLVGSNYPLLAQAAGVISSPQVRNVATIGGALCQPVWCHFIRNGLKTWRAGGAFCYAAQEGADSRYYHSVMGGDDCFAVHPSDMAVALEALDASVNVSGPLGSKTVSVADFIPGNVWMGGVLQSHILAQNELVTGVRIPAPTAGSQGLYLKSRLRNAFDFAIASLAVNLTTSGGTITSSRIVFGGVAPAPFRDGAVEAWLGGQDLGSIDLDGLASQALSGAAPLQNNGYKVDVAKGLLKEAIGQLGQQSD